MHQARRQAALLLVQRQMKTYQGKRAVVHLHFCKRGFRLMSYGIQLLLQAVLRLQLLMFFSNFFQIVSQLFGIHWLDQIILRPVKQLPGHIQRTESR